MNKTELEMLQFLKGLKENSHIAGIKISYEDEGLTTEMAQIIASIAAKAGVPVSVKIGGCEAKRDLHNAKILGADKIVAPMIETPYALKKFVEAVRNLYDDDEITNTKFLINIETITGYQNLKQMMARPEAKDIYGIVLGRVDFCGSMDKERSFINSEEMQNIALDMANIAKENGKKFFIGGGVSFNSLNAFRKIPTDVLTAFETRNIIFDAQQALNDPKIELGLANAQGFELAWMKRKKEFYGRLSNSETKRIDMISQRYNEALSRLKKELHD